MATDLQIAANRANAALSTGPKSRAGKARVRFNAKKFGQYALGHIMPGEDRASYMRLSLEVYATCAPEGPLETSVCEQIFAIMWRLQRLNMADTAALKRSMITVALTTKRFRTGSSAPAQPMIDFALSEILVRDPQHPGTPHVALDEATEEEDGGPRLLPIAFDTPPTGMTFLHAFGSEPSNKPSAEIERLKRVAMKEISNAHAMLLKLQSQRHSRESIEDILPE